MRLYDLIFKRKLSIQHNPGHMRESFHGYGNGNDSENISPIDVEDASRLINSVLDGRDKCILVLLFKMRMHVGGLT
jgi:hypothetical protein